ncbi:aspartyl protease family protein [Marchantia polymorpha subsp. ruderalis]
MASGKRRNSEILWSSVGVALSTLVVLLVLAPALAAGNENAQERAFPEANGRSPVVIQLHPKHAAGRVHTPLQATAVELVDTRAPQRKSSSLDRKLLAGIEREAEREESLSLIVEMVHKSHPKAPTHKRRLTQHEHVHERILADAKRVKELKKELHAKISMGVPDLSAVADAAKYDFLTPVVSGFTLGSGQYFVDFYLGTPPQKFSLIADTGSDLIWVQCPPCVSCYSQIGPIFAPQDSSTYAPLSCVADECQMIPAPLNFTCSAEAPVDCAYAYSYADQSITEGVFSTDTATMNVSKDGQTVRISNVAFGCGNFNVGPSLKGAGGVIGLGQGPTSFTSQIGAYFGNKFSYCLVDYLDATSITSTLVFGEAGKRAKEQAQYTPFVQNPNSPTFYYVGVKCVSVGGRELDIHPQVWEITELGDGGSIFDSGTSLTVFLEPAYLVILNAFQTHICPTYTRVPALQGLDLCFSTERYEDDPFAKLPAFSVTFQNGAVFSPPPQNVYVEVAENTMCLAMQGSSSPFGFNIFGNLIQQNFEVAYDRQKQRLGFAPADC